MNELPLVSILIAARNEAEHIERSLDSIRRQSYPLDRIEVIVADGGSDDGTGELASSFLSRLGCARGEVLVNPKRTAPTGLNAALARSGGSFVLRVDARSSLPPGYVRRCVEILQTRPEVSVVGGAQVARPHPDATLTERAIARALRNPYFTGFSRYRRRNVSGPSETVYLGAFRRDQLIDENGWDERLSVNQDFDLNRRMARRGLVWLDQDLEVDYSPRRSLSKVIGQYRRFGRWKAARWLETDDAPVPRQMGLLTGAIIAAGLATSSLRRRPKTTVATCALGLVCIDAFGGRGGPVAERVIAPACGFAISSAWLVGVGEQLVRYVAGQRLVSDQREP